MTIGDRSKFQITFKWGADAILRSRGILIQNSSSNVLLDLHFIDVHICLSCIKLFFFLIPHSSKVYQVAVIKLPFAGFNQNLFCGFTNFFCVSDKKPQKAIKR